LTICFLAAQRPASAEWSKAPPASRTKRQSRGKAMFYRILVAFLARQNPLAVYSGCIPSGRISASGGFCSAARMPDASGVVLAGNHLRLRSGSDAFMAKGLPQGQT